jgi:hypothetical protein
MHQFADYMDKVNEDGKDCIICIEHRISDRLYWYCKQVLYVRYQTT